MKREKLQQKLTRLQAQGKGHLRAARRAQAHLNNVQWEPTGIRTFLYSPWKSQRKAKRKRTVANVRQKEHVVTRIKTALFGPRSFIVRWTAGLRMREGRR